MPGLGAGTFGALLSLHIGWNLDGLFILDSDRQGIVERQRYIGEYGVSPNKMVLLSDLLPELTQIEDLIDDEASTIIAGLIGSSNAPTKPQIRRFFQEHLASNKVVALGPKFTERSVRLLDEILKRIAQK